MKLLTESDRLKAKLKYAEDVLHEAEIAVMMCRISVQEERFAKYVRDAQTGGGE